MRFNVRTRSFGLVINEDVLYDFLRILHLMTSNRYDWICNCQIDEHISCGNLIIERID